MQTFPTTFNYFLCSCSSVLLPPPSVWSVLLFAGLCLQLGDQGSFGQGPRWPLLKQVPQQSYVAHARPYAHTRFFKSLSICVHRPYAIFKPLLPSPVSPLVHPPSLTSLFSCCSPYLLLLPSLSLEWAWASVCVFILLVTLYDVIITLS